MCRKILNGLLVTVLTVTGVMFTSCQDYDEDIKNLNDQIASTTSSLTSLINEKCATLESEISSLQSQMSSLDAAYKAADAALEAAIEKAGEDAKAYADDAAAAAEAAAKDYAEIQAAAAEKAAIEAAQAALDEAVATLQAALDEAVAALMAGLDDVNAHLDAQDSQIADILARLDAQDLQIEALIEADVALQKGIDEAAALAQKALDTATTALSLAQSNEEWLTSLQKDVTTLQSQVSVLETKVEDALEQAAQNAADILALETELKSLEESNELAHEALQGQIDALDAKIDANQEAIEKALADLETELKEAVADALAEAEAYADEVAEALSEKFQGQVDAINASLDEIIKYANSLGTDVAALQSEVAAQAAQIAEIEEALGQINQYLGLLGKRLTSLVFAPVAYVDGIESIMFATVTLSYVDWGTDYDTLDVAPEDGEVYTISIPDQTHFEEYLFSPSNMDVKSIESLVFVSNTATNVSTKAVSEESPVEVKSWEVAVNENGVTVMKVEVEKTGKIETDDAFTTVALKATIADEFKLDSEIESGEEVAVFSDWARVYDGESTVTPYIHNAIVGEGVNDYGKVVESKEDDGTYANEHFYSYTQIHTSQNGGSTNRGSSQGTPMQYGHLDDYSVVDVVYNETLDLNELVLVCDKEGHSYDLDTYGFAFSFSTIEFWASPTNDTSTAVDQAGYAEIDENGVISAVGGRDAIGKYPVIQVVLTDTATGCVVDVRYFAICWTDEQAEYDLGTFTFVDNYTACGNEYEIVVAPTVIESRLGLVGDMTFDELVGTYTLLEGLYSTPYVYEGGISTMPLPKDYLGTVEVVTDDDTETTNIIWSVIPEITQLMYDNGEGSIHAYGAFVSESGSNFVTFELVLNLSIPQMELVANHNDPYWYVMGGYSYPTRVVNPGLETDSVYGTEAGFATTQMICNLYMGYIKEGVIPSGTGSSETGYPSMVNFGDEQHINFDESRLQEVADATGTKVADWTVNSTGLQLSYQGEIAAHIHYNNTIDAVVCNLEESDNGSAGSVPTDGAKLLIGNYVPVVFTDTWCSVTAELDHFNVAFMVPLALDSEEVIEITLSDIFAGGSSTSTSLDGTISLVEEAVANHRVVWDNATVTKAVDGLADWYGVEEPVYDVNGAKTNLMPNGTVSTADFEDWTTILSDITIAGSNEPAYRIEYVEETNQIVFYNASGNAISQGFKISVPVTIATKWQDVIALNVILTIEPSL